MNKKMLVLLIVVAALILAGCNPFNSDSSSDSGSKKWTVLVHFAVDNNIDYDFEDYYRIVTNYLQTLEAVKGSDVNSDINILVLMDCYNDDTQEVGYESDLQDGYYCLTGGFFANDLEVGFAEINSGSLVDIRAFMDWAVSNYPADNYVYSVFNHGSGFDDYNIEGTYSSSINFGIGFDDSSNDSLSHNELEQATSYLKGLIGKKIDLVYTYACLMGGVELSYELKDNADYLLFSEELFPADYWSYEALLAIVENPSISAQSLGVEFCDSAYSYFEEEDIPFTLSLVDLSQMNNLYTEIDGFADIALSNISSSGTVVDYNNAASNAFSMCSYYDVGWYYIDLGDYMNNIIESAILPESVKTASADVSAALNTAVVYQRQYGYPDASGMSIFHNIWSSTYQYSISLYESILAFGSNSWVDYLNELDINAVSSFDEAITITVGAAALDYSIDVEGEQDCFQVALTAGLTYKIETYDNGGDSMDTVLYLYDSDGVLLDSNDDSTGLYSRIDYDCEASGTYYIMVKGFDGTSVGDYSIDVLTGSFAAVPSLGTVKKKATLK